MSDRSWLSRTALLVGEQGLDKLAQAKVLVVGLGGVGSYCAEFIARAGVGQMTIVDGDVVDPSNRNRQLPALATTHGMSKADLMAERLLQINPELKLRADKTFLRPDAIREMLSEPYDYVVDCIDSLTPKVTLISTAYERGYRLVSSMGAGGKFDPTRIKVVDIADTYQCNLAFYVRKRLRYRGILKGFPAVFSDEPPLKSSLMFTDGSNFKKSAFGTISYLPAAFGGVCSSVVITGLCGMDWKQVFRQE
jgi:tRNA A37 threonylcarbamoyladenosine dehydratase